MAQSKPASGASQSLSDEQMAVRVVWHYFMEGRTQADIAQALSTNRLRVNRITNEARRSGLVTITLNSRLISCVELELNLAREFGLDRAIIVPTPDDPAPALRDGDLAIVPVDSRANAFLAVLRPGQPPAALDHAALVTENHREFIRSLPQGACLQYQWPCTEDYLRQQLRTAVFELVTVRGERLYSLSTAGLAVHRLDTLALVGALRWPTLQAMAATWF